MQRTKLKNKQSKSKRTQDYFEKHMIFSVFSIGVLIIIVYSLFNLLMYGPSGQEILIFILKVIITLIVLFIIKLLLDMFDKKVIIDLRDL
ncbi:MAG: hypothetical protein WCF78_04020 [archaeon]